MVIPRGHRRITYSSEIRALKHISFTKRQESIILGSLLGDGSLSISWSGSSKNYRFAVTHSIKQTDYINWMYTELQPFALTEPRVYDKLQKSVILRTISHTYLTELRDIFYPDGKKHLPDNIRQIIQDKLALAVWFMDDGNVVKRDDNVIAYILNTQSFTKTENEQIIRLFKELHNIHFLLDKNKSKYRLRVAQKASRDAFVRLITAHIIPSMRYKIG